MGKKSGCQVPIAAVVIPSATHGGNPLIWKKSPCTYIAPVGQLPQRQKFGIFRLPCGAVTVVAISAGPIRGHR